jgi:predicted DNA-binding transcriptional regulator YafY
MVRASRLVSIVLLLQARGQLRAQQLAEALEVTVRTIYRDIDSLIEAGVPVVGEAGTHGGYHLLEGYRTRLTGLTLEEAQSLSLTGVPAAAAALGLAGNAAAARLKLMAAIHPAARDSAERARQRIHLDPTPWGSTGNPDPWLPRLHQAVWDDRLIRIRYATAPRGFPVSPLGLVCKGTNWYLVARRGTDYRTYRVSRIQDVTLTGTIFERPADFDLVRHWHDASSAYAETFPRTVVRLRLRGDAVTRARWVQARSRTMSDPGRHGWVDAELVLEDEDNALAVIRLLGTEVIVLEPGTLRRKAVTAAQAFIDANSQPAGPSSS